MEGNHEENHGEGFIKEEEEERWVCEGGITGEESKKKDNSNDPGERP